MSSSGSVTAQSQTPVATANSTASWKCPVKLLEEKEVVRDWWYGNNALFCREGTIILPVEGILATERKGEGKEEFSWRAIFVSSDAGASWVEKEKIEVQFTNKEGTVLHRGEGLSLGLWHQLSDGSIIGVDGNITNDLSRPEQEYKPWISAVRRAKSPQALLSGHYVDDFTKIAIPNLASIQGDSPNPTTGNACKVVEMDDGDLLMPMEGRFYNDTVRVPYHEWEAYQFRSWVCRSTDRGYTWNYLATIASANEHPLPAMSEGYCEPSVISLGGRKLLAVLRTGGNPTGNGSLERYTSLVTSLSPDRGVTWTAPKPIYKYGVFPRLLKMSTGTIVCSSGRPGVFLLFSKDQGVSWSEPHIVTDYHVKWGECSSGYTSIGETEPGVLCLFYDDVYRNEKGQLSNLVKMRKYQVG
jgi:hypothetical protein